MASFAGIHQCQQWRFVSESGLRLVGPPESPCLIMKHGFGGGYERQNVAKTNVSTEQD
jgi:hypothetical protein